jgi:microsomal epoxide hydrolase
MSIHYSRIPDTATLKLEPFKIAISDEAVEELHVLLKYSKVAQPTYESLQKDRRYGITHEWLQEAKRYWLDEFKWCLYSAVRPQQLSY